jgi:hypothetical protein
VECNELLLYFSERICTPNSDGNEAIDFAVSNSDCRRIPNGYQNSKSENDSLPSTSKQDPESKYWRSSVGQKQQSYSGPVESGVNSSTTERRAITLKSLLILVALHKLTISF